jgi:hypothetical protein
MPTSAPDTSDAALRRELGLLTFLRETDVESPAVARQRALIEEVLRLRGILGETERAIADLVQVVGMDYDPELHPADTLRQFDAALGERLNR